MSELIISNIWALGIFLSPVLRDKIVCMVFAVLWLIWAVAKNGVM